MANRVLTFDLKDGFKDLIEIDEDDGSYVACFLPRTKLSSFYALPYSKNAGIYFLLSDKKIKYVGKAKNLTKRLRSHDENFWKDVLIISSSKLDRLADDRDDKILFLEKFFIDEIGVDNLENQNLGNKTVSDTNKSTRSMLDKYIDFAHITLAFFATTKLSKKKKTSPINDNNAPNKKRDTSKLIGMEFHYIVKKHNIDNIIVCQADNIWVVKAGAKLKPNTADENNAKRIEQLRNMNKSVIENNITTENITFSSSSQAGMFMHGQCINTWTSFVTEDGLSMDDVAKG